MWNSRRRWRGWQRRGKSRSSIAWDGGAEDGRGQECEGHGRKRRSWMKWKG